MKLDKGQKVKVVNAPGKYNHNYNVGDVIEFVEMYSRESYRFKDKSKLFQVLAKEDFKVLLPKKSAKKKAPAKKKVATKRRKK